MPYALVVIGLILIITGIQNTYAQFAKQLQTDLNSVFLFWILALASVGALGYFKTLRQFSHYFMALILISMILAQKGFIANFMAALKAGPQAPTAAPSDGTAAVALSPQSSTSALDNAIQGNQSGLTNALPGGSTNTPANAGQAKFNGWMNFFLGLGTNSSANAGATK